MRWEGSAMLRRSPRRTLEAIVTQATTAGQPLRHLPFIRARGANFLAREVAALIRNLRGEVGHRNESPEFTTQVSLVGSSTSRSIE